MPSVLGRSPVPASGELRGEDVDNYAQLRGVLAFERHWWRHAGAKEEAIRREFGVGPTAYYQLLSRLIDDPAAMTYDPMLVKRLQRQRASRRRQRSRTMAQAPSSGGGERPGTASSTLPTTPTS